MYKNLYAELLKKCLMPLVFLSDYIKMIMYSVIIVRKKQIGVETMEVIERIHR